MGHCMFLRKGETHTAPLSGILASDIAVGSTVKLMENGVAVDYLVVNQGIPGGSSLYDASCDGMWVLRKDIYEGTTTVWHGNTTNLYSSSHIHNYLNSTYLSLFDDMLQEIIKSVKIPYGAGNGTTTVYSGSNGVETKVFLLAGFEVTSTKLSYVASDGSLLSYFSDNTNEKRIATRSGTADYWWLRTPDTSAGGAVYAIDKSGVVSMWREDLNYFGIRPALILPNYTLFDKDTLLVKGVLAGWYTFSQPTLTADGTLGGDSFAVSASNITTGYEAWHAFSSDSSVVYSSAVNPSSQTVTFTIYNPKSLKITNMTFSNVPSGLTSSSPKAFTVEGSNDNSNWKVLGTYSNTNNTNGAEWSIDINPGNGYQYYRLVITSANTTQAYMNIGKIKLTGTVYEQ